MLRLTQKAKITELEKNAHQVEELTKENSNMATELAALCEHVERIKVDAIVEFQTSQPYFDELGDQFA